MQELLNGQLTPEQRKDLARRDVLRERYTVLAECVEIIEALRRRYSVDLTGLEPKPGFESAFAGEEKRLAVLRGIMQDVRAEENVILRRLYCD